MSKKYLVALLCIGLIVIIYFFVASPSSTPTPVATPAPTPGSISLEDKICAAVSAHYGVCKKVITDTFY